MHKKVHKLCNIACFIKIVLAVLPSNVNLGQVNHLIQLDINFFENVEVLGRTIPNKNCSRMTCDLKTAYGQTYSIIFKTFEAVSCLSSFERKI